MTSERRYAVAYASAVASQMDRALRWWSAHRDKSPGLLSREIGQVLDLIAVRPQLGQRASTRRFGALHRLLLPRSKFHLYYRIVEDEMRVELLLFRHAVQQPPP